MEITFSVYSFLMSMLALVQVSQAVTLDREAYCAACNVVMNEIQYEISIVSPNKFLEIESSRIDPQGNRAGTKIPFARSETHLTEVFEKVCERMNKYADSKDKKTGKKMYKRMEPLPGQKRLTLDNISISQDSIRKLTNHCNNILEDYEEELMKYLKEAKKEPAQKFCVDVAPFCDDAVVDEDIESTQDESTHHRRESSYDDGLGSSDRHYEL